MSALEQAALLDQADLQTYPPQYRLAPVGTLAEHPAQMRTVYDPAEMAALTLQVYTRDLDAWQPIVAAPRPDGSGHWIISGHRRRMARLFAWALAEWRAHPDSGVDLAEPVTIEQVQAFLTTLLGKYEFVDDAAAALATRYAAKTISFVEFQGSAKEQVLALQRANYGAEAPDVLGIARSFEAALKAGATPEEIARNTGQTAQYVRNHLALTQVAQELAEKVADGTYPLGLAVAVAAVEGQAPRDRVTLFILSNDPSQITVKGVRELVSTLNGWPGLQPPLQVAHQTQRNVARMLVHLWTQMVQQFPVQAYAIVAAFLYQRVSIQAPWETPEATSAWIQALGGETYWDASAQQPRWEALITHLLPEVACAGCPIANLPRERLASDLSPGRADLLGMPCRHNVPTPKCIHGFAPSDPLVVRVPLDWAAHPGVVRDGPHCVVTGFDTLQAAWHAQQAAEQAEAATEAATAAEAVVAYAEAQTEADLSAIAAASTTSPTGTDPRGAEAATPQTVAQPAPPTPVQQQRANLGAFMRDHLQGNAAHPWATPCHTCQHKLEGSPTKDASVPPCAWAARAREVTFYQLRPDGAGVPVPVCRQYAPNARWSELIPAHPAPGKLPREWLKRHLLDLSSRRHAGQGRQTFEWLTGRPMTKDIDHSGWFQEQLESQIGELSDAQLYTLFIWAHDERLRLMQQPFSLPAAGGQFSPVREIHWTPAKEPLDA